MAQRLTSKILSHLISRPLSQNLSSSSRSMAVTTGMRKLPSLLSRNSHLKSFSGSQRAMNSNVALREFLKEEIDAEKELAKKQMGEQTVPTLSGFQVKTDDAEVTLTKNFKTEKITVTFNVNDCVRPLDDIETGTMDKFEQDSKEDTNFRIQAEPSFRVEIEKNNQKLIFECDYAGEYQHEDGPQDQIPSGEEESHNDLFNITSVYMTTGEITDKVYGASGEIIDGTFYDHLFEYLAERGIDNKFADDLIRFSTHYEHAQYVNLLQKLKEFVSS